MSPFRGLLTLNCLRSSSDLFRGTLASNALRHRYEGIFLTPQKAQQSVFNLTHNTNNKIYGDR